MNTKKLVKFFDGIVLNYLKQIYKQAISEQNYKIIDDFNWVSLPNTTLEKEFDMSAYQIRECLNRLEDVRLIQTKFGHSRERFFLIRKSCYEELISKIKSMSDEKLLKLNEYIDKELNND